MLTPFQRGNVIHSRQREVLRHSFLCNCSDCHLMPESRTKNFWKKQTEKCSIVTFRRHLVSLLQLKWQQLAFSLSLSFFLFFFFLTPIMFGLCSWDFLTELIVTVELRCLPGLQTWTLASCLKIRQPKVLLRVSQ